MYTCIGIDLVKTIGRTPSGKRIRINFHSDDLDASAAIRLFRSLGVHEPVIESHGVLVGIIEDCDAPGIAAPSEPNESSDDRILLTLDHIAALLNEI